MTLEQALPLGSCFPCGAKVQSPSWFPVQPNNTGISMAPGDAHQAVLHPAALLSHRKAGRASTSCGFQTKQSPKTPRNQEGCVSG